MRRVIYWAASFVPVPIILIMAIFSWVQWEWYTHIICWIPVPQVTGIFFQSSFKLMNLFLISEWANHFQDYNLASLEALIDNRPEDTPLITVANHQSCLDDPCLWGKVFKSWIWILWQSNMLQVEFILNFLRSFNAGNELLFRLHAIAQW